MRHLTRYKLKSLFVLVTIAGVLCSAGLQLQPRVLRRIEQQQVVNRLGQEARKSLQARRPVASTYFFERVSLEKYEPWHDDGPAPTRWVLKGWYWKDSWLHSYEITSRY